MDIVNAVVRLVEVTVWPITILIIVLWFRSTITDAIKHLIRQRIIRARIGKFELEFHAGEEISIDSLPFVPHFGSPSVADSKRYSRSRKGPTKANHNECS